MKHFSASIGDTLKPRMYSATAAIQSQAKQEGTVSMDKWSTLNISMNLFTTVCELFREFRSPEIFEAGMPYELVTVEDAASRMDLGYSLAKEFLEKRYYVMNGNSREVMTDAAWHEDDGLVNFSFLLMPKALFKKRLINTIFTNYVVPYVKNNTGSTRWLDFSPDQKCLTDERKSLMYCGKFYLDHPVSFGLSVIELKYSGI